MTEKKSLTDRFLDSAPMQHIMNTVSSLNFLEGALGAVAGIVATSYLMPPPVSYSAMKLSAMLSGTAGIYAAGLLKTAFNRSAGVPDNSNQNDHHNTNTPAP